jgi:hypothetical protein
MASDGSVALSAVVQGGVNPPAIGSLDATGQSRYVLSGFDAMRAYEVTPVLAESGGAMLVAAIRTSHGTLDGFRSDGARDGSVAAEFAIGNVRALARDVDGSVLAAGDFLEIDGMAYACLIRLQAANPAPRLANISTRGYVGPNNEILIAGFYVAGDEPQRVLIRGIAKNLEQFNVPNRATRVRLEIFRQGENTPFAQNEVWWSYWMEAENLRLERYFQQVGAFPLTFINSRLLQNEDSALLLDLPPGGYTVHLRASLPGIALIEAYDANGIAADRKLINISTRGRVGIGDEKLIAGFVITDGIRRVLIRAVGPGLATFVGGTLANPAIELVRQSDSATIATNDDWGSAPNAAEIATITPQVTGLALANGSADAALLVDLPAGAYTAVVSGVGNTTGIALAEVYEVP